MTFSTIPDAVQALKQKSFVLVVDDEDRENEGDLILAAEFASEGSIAFLVRHTSGVLTVPLVKQRLDELQLPQMVQHNNESQGTAFTVSVDYAHRTTSGISAADRALTIRELASPNSVARDFNRPGHIFPLQYREGGVLKRAGHTEASIDLMLLAGLRPAAVIGELVNDDGSMKRGKELFNFAKEYAIPIITIADLIRYRLHSEKLVTRISEAPIPTPQGVFTTYAYKSSLDNIHHVALVMGNIFGKTDVLVRVHSECLTGDVFGSLRCDCGSQLQLALQMIAEKGEGVLVYLRGHEGRGIGIGHKLRAYNLQDKGLDTVEANVELGLPIDSREYGIGAQILRDLGIRSMHLLTNNPGKFGGLCGYDLTITGRVPLHTKPTKENEKYLKTKEEKLGHLMHT